MELVRKGLRHLDELEAEERKEQEERERNKRASNAAVEGFFSLNSPLDLPFNLPFLTSFLIELNTSFASSSLLVWKGLDFSGKINLLTAGITLGA